MAKESRFRQPIMTRFLCSKWYNKGENSCRSEKKQINQIKTENSDSEIPDLFLYLRKRESTSIRRKGIPFASIK